MKTICVTEATAKLYVGFLEMGLAAREATTAIQNFTMTFRKAPKEDRRRIGRMIRRGRILKNGSPTH